MNTTPQPPQLVPIPLQALPTTTLPTTSLPTTFPPLPPTTLPPLPPTTLPPLPTTTSLPSSKPSLLQLFSSSSFSSTKMHILSIAFQACVWLTVILAGIGSILWYEQSVGWKDFVATINKDDLNTYDEYLVDVWIAAATFLVFAIGLYFFFLS